jgi:Tfp pilus assembly protein PilN
MIKTILTLSLGMIIGVLILNYVFNSHDISEDAIMHLKTQNDSLLKQNLKIDSINKQLHENLAKEDEAIELLNEKDLHQQIMIKELNTKIKTLNKKYEKANNYSNDYNSNEISSYFSNLR